MGLGHLAIACKVTFLVASAAHYVCQCRKIHCLFFFGVALCRYLLVPLLHGLKAAVKEAAVHGVWISLGWNERYDLFPDLLVIQETAQVLQQAGLKNIWQDVQQECASDLGA